VIVVGEPVALLAMLTLAPFTAPGVLGANVTVSVADCPGVSIVPFDTPLALKPAPVTVTPETVMFEFPLLVSVVESWIELFTFTVPKLKLVGLAAKICVAETPVPLTLIVIGEGVPFVVSLIVPLTVAVEVGVKTALNAMLPPASIVVAVDNPVMVIPVPVTVIFENLSVALPLFRSVTGCELLFPTTTFAKATLVGEAAIWA